VDAEGTIDPAGATSGPIDVRGGGLDSTTLVARLPGTSVLDLEVAETVALTPAMRRLRLRADGLADFSYLPGQDLMLAIPGERETTFRRRYTIRRLDRRTGLLDIDVVLHGDGPGARWAASAVPGDHVEAIGPRGKITVAKEVDWHLMVGDESALPGFFAMLEALSSPAAAVVLVEVDGPDEEQQPDVAPDVHLELRWLHRAGRPPGTSELLAGALAARQLPAGPGHAYLAGELAVVAELRRGLAARGLSAEQVSPKPYWRLGVANAAHGEPLGD